MTELTYTARDWPYLDAAERQHLLASRVSGLLCRRAWLEVRKKWGRPLPPGVYITKTTAPSEPTEQPTNQPIAPEGYPVSSLPGAEEAPTAREAVYGVRSAKVLAYLATVPSATNGAIAAALDDTVTNVNGSTSSLVKSGNVHIIGHDTRGCRVLSLDPSYALETSADDKLLAHLASVGVAQTGDLSGVLGVTRDEVRRLVIRLTRQGRIVRVGENQHNRHGNQYALPRETNDAHP